MKQKYYWIIGIIVVLAIIGIIFTFLPSQRTISSRLLEPCPGLYYLETSLNQNILDDQQAFDALKQFWRVYNTEGGTVVFEDDIPSDMTAEEAIQEGIFRSGQIINLSGEGGVVDNVWMLYQHRAVDVKGDIYFCDFNVDIGPVPPPSTRKKVCGDGYCHLEENYETCPEDCPVPVSSR